MVKRLSNFVFTLNNYDTTEMEQVMDFISTHARYGIFGKEVSKSGTPHLQGYIELTKQTAFKKTKKMLPKGIHIEQRHGTSKQASDYCCKEDKTPFVFGVMSQPGKRTDINDLKDIMKETGSITECFDHNFGLTCRIQRGLETYNRKRKRSSREVTVTHGHLGDLNDTPESFTVYYDPSQPMMLWSSYDGQKIVNIIYDTDPPAVWKRIKTGHQMNLNFKGGTVPCDIECLNLIRSTEPVSLNLLKSFT